ncbi:hypothetical protein PK28_13565 [Hymenobacter sp. DG25B]|nr:hypothetical protein PK28_13565 [Hymenobacter sp. DG25B]
MFYSLLAGLVLTGATPGRTHAWAGPTSNSSVSARPTTVVVENGLTASYYPNGTFAGAPVLRRVDASVDFNWGLGAPSKDLPTDYFSVRWEGLLVAPTTGTYRFQVPTNDEIRLWVNGKKVLDTWDGRREDNSNAFVQLAANEKTSIKLEYVDADGEAHLQLQWLAPGKGLQIIPMENLYPLGSSIIPAPATAPVVAAAVVKPAPAPAPVTPTPVTPAPKVAPAQPVAPKPVAAAPAPAPVVAKPAAPAPKPAAVPVAAPKPAPKEKAVAAAPAEPSKKAAKPEKVVTKPKPPVAAATPKPTPAAPKPATPKAPARVEPAVYIITSRATGRPLEVQDPSRPNMRAYQTVPSGGTAATPQNETTHWRIEQQNDGFYRLMVPGNNRVLEVLGSSTSNGAALNLWPYYSGNNQQWNIELTEDGYYKIVAKHSKKALTARDSTDTGIVQWRFKDNETQDWKLTKVVPNQNRELLQAAVERPGIGANRMSLYPNPSNGVVQLTYRLPEELPVGWVLYNQNGAVVRVSDYRRRTVGIQLQTLEFTDLPPGDYYLHLTVGTTTTRHSLKLRKPSATTPEASAGE